MSLTHNNLRLKSQPCISPTLVNLTYTKLLEGNNTINIRNVLCNNVYRVSQEECEILRESVPYVKLYRYNPKHLYPKLNGYGDNGQRSLKLWQLLHTYWLPNTYLNWQEYVVSVMLISVHNIKVTCEWHKAIKLNYKNSRTNTRGCLRVPSTCISSSNEVLSYRVRRGSFAVKLANVRARKQ